MPRPSRTSGMTVPLYRFEATAADEAAVLAALRNGHWADGPGTRALEQAFAQLLTGARGEVRDETPGEPHRDPPGGPSAGLRADAPGGLPSDPRRTLEAIAVSSGTAALQALCHACLQPGDDVLTTPFSFVATANVVRAVGAVPHFGDVEPDTGNLDPESAARWLAGHPRARAILIVHLYGQPCRLAAFRELADRHNVLLLEDCAQAAGATWRGVPVGTIGDAAAFSLYSTKNLAAGEGGIVVTRDPHIARAVRQFINHGRSGRGPYDHDTVGLNLRMSGLTAAFAASRLERLVADNEARFQQAQAYHNTLAHLDWLSLPPLDPGHVYHQFVIRTRWRDALQRHLANVGIETAVHYPVTIPDQPAYRDWRDCDIPVARQVAREVLSLPIRPSLTEAERAAVCAAIASFTPPAAPSGGGASGGGADGRGTAAPDGLGADRR